MARVNSRKANLEALAERFGVDKSRGSCSPHAILRVIKNHYATIDMRKNIVITKFVHGYISKTDPFASSENHRLVYTHLQGHLLQIIQF